MEIRIVGIDFPPPRTTRQSIKEALDESLDGLSPHIEKIEVYLSELSALPATTGTRCSAVVFFKGRLPVLVEADAPKLDAAIAGCISAVSTVADQQVSSPGPGPGGLSALFE